MLSYELRYKPSRGNPVSSVFFRGNAASALILAQQTSRSSELLLDGAAICAIELDDKSGFWIISRSASSQGEAH